MESTLVWWVIALSFAVVVWNSILTVTLYWIIRINMEMNQDMIHTSKEVVEQQKQLGIHAELMSKQEEAIQRLENKPVDAIGTFLGN